MRHVAAYLLAVLGGNANPTAKDLKSILGSVGVEAETKQLTIVIAQLKGKSVTQLIAEGTKLLAADVPSGGGGGGAAKAAAPVVEKPVEKAAAKPVVEDSDSEDSDMGMGLFDD
jgi:large subunit ribosomal protein LP2